MGYVPPFTNDIFVSYRRSSNEGRDKWVDTLCDELRQRLNDIVGEISIWQDTRALRAGDTWRPEIAAALDDAAIFLAVISRTYFDSDMCRGELDHVLGRVKEPATARRRRIIPIFKQPTKPGQELPHELTEIEHHEFFQPEPPPSLRFHEFSPAQPVGPFWETLERLAQDLMAALDELKGQSRQEAVGTVYLARVGPELHNERAKLRADLQQRGYLVLPEREYFWNAADFHENIAADLDAAQLCIHQIARTASLDARTPARAKLQLELATRSMKSKGKPLPLIWIQPTSEPDSTTRALVDYIEGELSNEGVEYSQASLEDFKTQIYDKLAPRTPPRTAAPAASDVALIVEEADLPATGAITELLAEKLRLEPRRIKFSGSGPKDPSSVTRTLARCRRCIVFWGAQSEEWVREVLSLDVLTDFVGKQKLCVFCAVPPSPEKTTFKTNKARTIDATASTHEADLRQFLEVMEAGDEQRR